MLSSPPNKREEMKGSFNTRGEPKILTVPVFTQESWHVDIDIA